MDADAPPLEAHPDGARLFVRVTPRAARPGIQGIAKDADGRARLKVGVSAAPEGGKANAAVVALLAKAWRLPKSALTVTAGATDRRKTLRLDADPQTVARIRRTLGSG